MSEPLFLKSVFKEKIWGGECLKKLFHLENVPDKIGEYWGISGHKHGVSVISNGQFENTPLDVLYQEHPELFNYPKDTVFPLLVKFLDAQEWLSVQVHPDDKYALEREGELGKTECWYILEARENSEIIFGHKAQTKAELQALFQEGAWNKLLQRVKVKKGDFYYVPSGTLHAIGPGILLLETQQSSDTTYRVYDFDRVDDNGVARTLHLEQALDVTSLEKPVSYKKHYQTVENVDMTMFMSNEFFTVERWDVRGRSAFEKGEDYKLFTVIDGEGSLYVDGKEYLLVRGDNFILPSPVKKWTFSGRFSVMVSQI